MSTVTGGGIASSHNKNPMVLPKFEINTARIFINNTGSFVSPGSTSFWDALDSFGASERTVSKPADTWYTITDITGSGFLTAIQGWEANLGVAHLSDFRITVDGLEYLIENLYGSGTNRAFVGAAIQNSDTATVGERSPNQAMADTAALTANSQSRFNFSGGLPFLFAPQMAISEGMRTVRFDESLKVEIKSDAISAATSPDCIGQCQYVLD